MNIKKLLIGAGLTGSLLLASAAQATIMTDEYTESFSFNSYNSLYDLNAGKDANNKNYLAKKVNSKKITIDRFDGSLGTLLGVEISFDSVWSLTSTVHSYDRRFGNFTASGRGRAISNQQIRLIDPFREIASNNEVVKSNCKDKPDCQTSDTSNGNFDGNLDLSGFSLSDFIGTDMLDFRVVRTLKSDLTFCGVKDSCWEKNSNNAWNGNIHVAYTYSVPEPGTLALFGLGLAGLGVSRMKKQKV